MYFMSTWAASSTVIIKMLGCFSGVRNAAPATGLPRWTASLDPGARTGWSPGATE